MAVNKVSSSSSFSVGNCTVEIDGKDFVTESSCSKSLVISVSGATTIKISENAFRKRWSKKTRKEFLSRILSEENGGGQNFNSGNYSFQLLNPKDIDSRTKFILQDVIKLYKKELPTMSYAANTGKESSFLEKCVSSGKYRTFLLKSNATDGYGEVMAAISFQMINADVQYAEIPLAVVSRSNQRKGVGHFLYMELRKRLQNVGVSVILCWGDKESEGFWLKQGFVPLADVDTKGRARRLPIKAEIRKALCFPGASILMVSHLDKDTSMPTDLPNQAELNSPLWSCARPCTSVPVKASETGYGAFGKRCPCSGQSEKRKVWESSLSSLKSKKVKGGHHINCCKDFHCNVADESECRNGTNFAKNSLDAVRDKSLSNAISSSPQQVNFTDTQAWENIVTATPKDVGNEERPYSKYPVVMLMNIADDVKKAQLTKIVEDLGGSITSHGSSCSHVITGKARRTLNFCTALCSGAWVVSPDWLKSSFREGRFVGESSFILKDEDYEQKYRSGLEEAISRAKARRNSLLKGYDVCIAHHILPPVDALVAIVESAGGNVVHGLEEVKEPAQTIFLACEEDMEEALEAAKRGVWTYSSEWLMCCIMRQELDFEAQQYAESL
ncbi:hypothetical protein H6P81_003687 [Aristolochia fimbriata]|uniref:BRCT domain-containing protein n=1 Tax=Aristolochia fimbriata TaxID=158543 RepID=A0AAV7FDT8_ARIFI|nr:hypothetical protein H6P81_003687 [Aristolochia fimbriata]